MSLGMFSRSQSPLFAFGLLLVWGAVYVRGEPSLVRLALCVVGATIIWSSVRELWSLIAVLTDRS